MRLIHTESLQFHEFEGRGSQLPPYAILSHTWGDEEVTFHDMASRPRSREDLARKKGYAKITQTCRLARQQNLEYAWIDTCCIDKSSSAELTESINSMFKWYEDSAVCFVFLSDYGACEVDLKACRWWTRGWTLQELLAPTDLTFYDSAWNAVGTKSSLLNEIWAITGIERSALIHKEIISRFSVAERMSWAASRQTTRLEDEAYCLLGIFGINLPLIYGEGRMAFRRLQEEIIKRSTDLTIFAWGTSSVESGIQISRDLFAESPELFHRVWPVRSNGIFDHFESPEFSMTNKGVLFSEEHPLIEFQIPLKFDQTYGLYIGDFEKSRVVILLRKLVPGFYCRQGCFRIPAEESRYWRKLAPARFYIAADLDEWSLSSTMARYRSHALHVPYHGQFRIHYVSPLHLWDVTDRLFLRPLNDANISKDPQVLVLGFTALFGETEIELIVLSQYGQDDVPGGLRIFETTRYPQQARELLEMDPEKPRTLSSLKEIMTDISSATDLTNMIQLTNTERITIRVCFKVVDFPVEKRRTTVNELTFEVTTYEDEWNTY
ncbi:heterokaryon incompatibility protein-domain-containing protein [Nemania sp. NC0429]|nr:heterokaryon incompatibility protein-domain-containing protein [Nemania sp. NC0429]